MRQITREELREYFQFAYKDRTAPEFTQEQARLIGDCVREDSRIFGAVGQRAVEAMNKNIGPEHFLLSLWVYAFQMGREFESRLFTAALQNGRLDPDPIAGIH